MTNVQARDVLRFMTAGSVDDGKSTLIGRLLFDSKGLMRDQIEALSRAKYSRAEPGELDLALVTDGLESEREQGITIDVAYRYFSTPQRAFVIGDAPGHEQYTRNMVTAASNADLAIIIVDASRVEGETLKPQTRRHTAIAQMLGLQIVVAVNKMDLLGWSQTRFEEIRQAFARLARTLDIEPLAYVPISARDGDNVVRRGGPGWYEGPTLIEVLNTAPARVDLTAQALRLPIQRVARIAGSTAAARRGYAGRIESGVLRRGDAVIVAPSGVQAIVASIETFGGPIEEAIAGQSVTVFLDRDVDAARGDTIASGELHGSKRVTADLCWLDTDEWVPNRKYLLRQGTLQTNALIEKVHFVREVTELAALGDATHLRLNDIASVRLRTQSPILADIFETLPGTGGFVLIDPVTHQTCAAGMIREAHDLIPHKTIASDTFEI